MEKSDSMCAQYVCFFFWLQGKIIHIGFAAFWRPGAAWTVENGRESQCRFFPVRVTHPLQTQSDDLTQQIISLSPFIAKIKMCQWFHRKDNIQGKQFQKLFQ